MLPQIVGGAALVFISAYLFADAIEWAAFSMKWTGSFAGSVITPLFTSLPELTVFILALTTQGEVTGGAIALGTVFGEPLAIVALSPFIVLAFTRGGRYFVLNRDARLPYLFTAAFLPFCLIPLFLATDLVQHIEAPLLLIPYALYALYQRRAGESIGKPDAEPRFNRMLKWNEGYLVQLALSIPLLYEGSSLVVHYIPLFARESGVPLLAVSILIIPASTALPETIISAIWAHSGKHAIALSALSGEAVLYSSFYPFLSLLLIRWSYSWYLAGAIALTSLLSFLYYMHSLHNRIGPALPVAGLAAFALYIIVLL